VRVVRVVVSALKTTLPMVEPAVTGVAVAVRAMVPVTVEPPAGLVMATVGPGLLIVTDLVAVPAPTVEVAVIDRVVAPLANVVVSSVHDGVNEALSEAICTPLAVSTEVGMDAAEPWVTVAETTTEPVRVAAAAGAVKVTVGLVGPEDPTVTLIVVEARYSTPPPCNT
jgi:hypothetical protein